ncbi:ribbon-helix-helix protein, CopG family [Aquincola sp. MAHUQ-54]|uniref:Ribbon-helix-helix protein, CopG family n=1 Tax=Aquincola agrisoli TaxID=3119538 RepID=A0AAW9QFQ4_9BURK
MSTTTIRLDDEMKMRITKAAERAGKTSHAFIVEAIAQTVEQAERSDEFHRVADERWARIVATGQTNSWEEMRAQLQSRAQEIDRPKPAAKKAARKASPPKPARGQAGR